MSRAYRVRWGAVAVALVALACDRTKKADHRGALPVPSVASAALAAPSELPSGGVLIRRFECARCHVGLGSVMADKQCVGCHDRVFQGLFGAEPEVTRRWKKNIRHLTRVPDLHDLGKRFRPEWLTEFLLEPHDLRPHLEETMPRFAMSREQAAQIAAWLTRDAPGAPAEAASPPATWQRGRDIYQEKRCAQCHEFTGIVPGDHPEGARDESFETARRLAPDLRFARDRMTRPAIARWLGDRTPVWPLRLMPAVILSPEEIEALSAFILESPLEPAAVQPPEPRLPLLTRAVTYDEVEKEVFHRTCWHCHAEPNYARGDGGPGNTGGFGFAGMRINFLGYETVLAGYRDPKGQPASLFGKNAEGVPRLVEALLARQDEERGHPRAEVRGMPLGLPSLRPEQIQLVETWIAQGRRR